jgi:type IV pilus assembly protein PilM
MGFFQNVFSSLGSSHVVGLSLGSSSIKLIELKRSGKLWKLVHFGMAQLPEDAILDREIVNSIAVTESIKTLINQIKLKNKQVCSSISGSSVIVKKIQLEVQNEKEIQEQIFWEAEQYLPFDVNEVVMDYQILTKKKASKKDILLVAVKKNILENYIGCIEEAGLKVTIMDVDFFALQHLYELTYPPQAHESVAIVDIGATSMKMVVICEGVPIFTKDTPLGGSHLTLEIQQSLNLSYTDAEILKVGGSQDGSFPQEVSDLMTSAIENFAMELKKSLDFYHASSAGPQISCLLLTGGSSKLEGLSPFFEESLGLPTQLINPFYAISYDHKVFTQEYVNKIAPFAAIPLGLAIRAGLK